MLTTLLVGGLLVGGFILGYFWDEIVNFLKRVINTVLSAIKGKPSYTKVFIRKDGNKVTEIVRCGYRKRYLGLPSPFISVHEERRVIDASDVPPDILARAAAREKSFGNSEVDITDDVEMKLANAS